MALDLSFKAVNRQLLDTICSYTTKYPGDKVDEVRACLEIKTIIESGADVNYLCDDDGSVYIGYSPLHLAMERGAPLSVVQTLLDLNADVEAAHVNYGTPLQYAIYDPFILEQLLMAKADVHAAYAITDFMSKQTGEPQTAFDFALKAAYLLERNMGRVPYREHVMYSLLLLAEKDPDAAQQHQRIINVAERLCCNHFKDAPNDDGWDQPFVRLKERQKERQFIPEMHNVVNERCLIPILFQFWYDGTMPKIEVEEPEVPKSSGSRCVIC